MSRLANCGSRDRESIHVPEKHHDGFGKRKNRRGIELLAWQLIANFVVSWCWFSVQGLFLRRKLDPGYPESPK